MLISTLRRYCSAKYRHFAIIMPIASETAPLHINDATINPCIIFATLSVKHARNLLIVTGFGGGVQRAYMPPPRTAVKGRLSRPPTAPLAGFSPILNLVCESFRRLSRSGRSKSYPRGGTLQLRSEPRRARCSSSNEEISRRLLAIVV